jgi:AcrR family transcriptional regulator
MSTSADPKGRILEAAARIVGQAGAAHLTMDAVAAEAGLSKGGVLYHFPSKRELLEGMLQKVLDDIAARTGAYRETFAEQPGAALRARIRADSEQSVAERAMALALLATAAEDPELLAPARAFVRDAFAEIRSAPGDADFALILLLATEGMRFLDMLDLLPLSARERQRLHGRLLSMAGEVEA